MGTVHFFLLDDRHVHFLQLLLFFLVQLGLFFLRFSSVLLLGVEQEVGLMGVSGDVVDGCPPFGQGDCGLDYGAISIYFMAFGVD